MMRIQLLLNAVITLALLGFSYAYELYIDKGSGVVLLVLGAVLQHWFKEVSQAGQEIARDKAVERTIKLKNGGPPVDEPSPDG